MAKYRHTDYVNVFHGNGEISPLKPEGIAAKWFFIKAGSGNTSPAATLPFGAMSVAPYSGGYPTGYGNHLVNCSARPEKFDGGEKLLGFAHLQQSGTGTIGFYLNYALVTPYYTDPEERRLPENENGRPGYYSCVLEDISCQLTAGNRVAHHLYTFGKENGKIRIDFSNNGIRLPDQERKTVENLCISCSNNIITASAVIEGINIYFAVSGSGDIQTDKKCACFSNFGSQNHIKVSISLISTDHAASLIESSPDDFFSVKDNADKIWEEALSRFDITTTDENIKGIFYSNLYHSLVKPCDWTGDSFLYDKKVPFMTDFATLWDMYKTALPMILMSYRETGEKIVETLLSLCDALGEIPNAFGLSDKYVEHSTQARTLGAYVLMTAYRYGVKIDPHRMIKAIDKDIFAPNKTDFTVDGKCKSNTWMLDMADCCALASSIAYEIGETEIGDRLKPLSEQWINAFDPATGLLSDDSSYYEGTKYNYSFRQMVNMDKRIEIAGGKEKFNKMLDDFFGYGKPDTVQPTIPRFDEPIIEGMKLGRFEGFNNESDTEAPFTYNYIGRHDRICEIIRAGMKYMFTSGKGGIPGNNDTGALSSYYVLCALGLFPVAGQDLFIIGSPFVDSATIRLSNDKELNVRVSNNSEPNIYVKSVRFNSLPVDNFFISAADLMNGGLLEFEMSSEK